MTRRAISAALAAVLLPVAGCWALLRPDPTASRRHPSPDGRYAVLLLSDTAFGQVETLLVLAEPNGPHPHAIFRHVGDTPLHFLGWRDDGTALLDYPPQAAPGYRLLLTCQGSACTLARAPPGTAP